MRRTSPVPSSRSTAGWGWGTDARVDVGIDVAIDVASDVAIDVAIDVPIDVAMDVAPDAPSAGLGGPLHPRH